MSRRIGRKWLRERTERAVAARVGTLQGRLVEIDHTARTCLVDVYGYGVPLLAARVSGQTSGYVPGMLVRLEDTGSLHRKYSVVGPGSSGPATPSDDPRATSVFQRLEGMSIRSFEGTVDPPPEHLVWVEPGMYRLGGHRRELEAWTLGEADAVDADLSWGVFLGSIGGVADLSPTPAVAGQVRFDLVTVTAAGVIGAVHGVPVPAGRVPQVPALPAGSARVGQVLRRYGVDEIPQADIGLVWHVPYPVAVEVDLEYEEMAWGQETCQIITRFLDQRGLPMFRDWQMTLSVTAGTGRVYAPGWGFSRTSRTQLLTDTDRALWTYYRDRLPGDVSPTLTLTVPDNEGLRSQLQISLLDEHGVEMT